jgi:hypothetical protein
MFWGEKQRWNNNKEKEKIEKMKNIWKNRGGILKQEWGIF